jgi:hypothetical protein
VLLLVAVATFQVTWPVWRSAHPARWPAVERAAIEGYQRAVAQLSPEKRRNLPSESAYVQKQRAEYERLRNRTVPYEWLFTGLALAGTAATAVAFGTTRPDVSAMQPSGRPKRDGGTRRAKQKKKTKPQTKKNNR